MAISPYRPTTEMFGPLFESLMTPWSGHRMESMLRPPEADVVETENEIRVTVETPGMKADDIEMNLENNVLTISGEKREERTEGDENSTWHLSERRYGKFSRSFVLPRDVEQEQIQANFDDGVLTVTIPKSEKARRRRIEIKPGTGHGQRVDAGKGEQKH